MQYSNDLRRKLVEAWQAGHGTQSEMAEVFGVSLGWVEKVLRRWRETGDTAALVFRHGPVSSLDPERVEQLVAQYPDATLAELGRHLKVSAPTLCRWLQRLGLRRKKSHSMRVSVRQSALRNYGRVGVGRALNLIHSS